MRALAEQIKDLKVRTAVIACCASIWTDVVAAGESLKELG